MCCRNAEIERRPTCMGYDDVCNKIVETIANAGNSNLIPLNANRGVQIANCNFRNGRARATLFTFSTYGFSAASIPKPCTYFPIGEISINGQTVFIADIHIHINSSDEPNSSRAEMNAKKKIIIIIKITGTAGLWVLVRLTQMESEKTDIQLNHFEFANTTKRLAKDNNKIFLNWVLRSAIDSSTFAMHCMYANRRKPRPFECSTLNRINNWHQILEMGKVSIRGRQQCQQQYSITK